MGPVLVVPLDHFMLKYRFLNCWHETRWGGAARTRTARAVWPTTTTGRTPCATAALPGTTALTTARSHRRARRTRRDLWGECLSQRAAGVSRGTTGRGAPLRLRGGPAHLRRPRAAEPPVLRVRHGHILHGRRHDDTLSGALVHAAQDEHTSSRLPVLPGVLPCWSRQQT